VGVSENVAGGTPGPGLFARLAQRASGAKAELEPRLGPRYEPATPGVRDAGLEVIEAEVPATDGAERPRVAGPSSLAANQPPLAPRPENPIRLEPPAVAGFEAQPVHRFAEREQETGERDAPDVKDDAPAERWSSGSIQHFPRSDVKDDAPVERWATGPIQHDAPEADTALVSGPPARTARTDHAAPATPDAPTVTARSRPVRETSAAIGPRAVAGEIGMPRTPATSADTRGAPALDVEIDAGDDGIPWSLLTGPVGTAREPNDPRVVKEGGRPSAADRGLEPLNDSRAVRGAARSLASPSPKIAEPASEPDEIHVHIGRIEVAASPVAPPRAARPRRQPRITLSDYLGLGSSRGGRR
jgi:hypothetical protein